MGFCPGCGKEIAKGVFCNDCRPPADLRIKDIVVDYCVTCNRFFLRNKWLEAKSVEDAVVRAAQDRLKSDYDINPILPEYKVGPGIRVDFEVELSKDDLFIVPGRINFTYCDRCKKAQGQYFEGILQLRRVNDDMLDFVEKYMGHKDILVSGKNKVDDGYDLKISDQRKLQAIGKQLVKNFGGELKVSVRQFTQDKLTSKQIYRVNVFYEGPEFSKGDVILYGRSVILVTSARKAVSGIDLKTGNRATVDVKKGFDIVHPAKTTVSKVYPEIEILDPETYQSVPVANRKEVSHGEKVRFVKAAGQYYLV